MKTTRKENYKEKFNLIANNNIKLLEKYKESTLVKAVGHATHQEGDIQLESLVKESPLSIRMQAGFPCFWLNKMHKATQLMHQNPATSLPEKENEILTKTLEFSSNLSTHAPAEILVRIQQDLPVILPTGYLDHSVSVLIWGSYFIICNRGESSRAPVEIFQYDKEKLNEKTIESILNSVIQSKEDYQKLFFETLPEELSFKQNELEKAIQKECNLPNQSVGNCSWVSPETAVWALLVLQKVRESEQPNIKEIVKNETKRFESWAVFNQLYHLERYMNVRQLRKPKEKKSVRTSYKTDIQIIEQGFANSRRMFKNKMIDPGVLKERNELYKYFKTSGAFVK